MALQIRRGTDAERLAIIPLQGELIFTTDNKEVFVGDGTTVGGVGITGSGGGGGGSGTVTAVSVTTANGFAGTVTNPTTTPAISMRTTVSGILKGNGTAVSAAAAGTDFQAPITLTTSGSSGAATLIGNTLNIPQYSGGGGGDPIDGGSYNISIIADDESVIVDAASKIVTVSSLTVGTATISSTGTAINLPTDSTANGSTIGTRVSTDDLEETTVANGTILKIIGGNGIQTSAELPETVTINASEDHIVPTLQADESTSHYLAFLDSFNDRSLVKVDGALQYTPSTGTLESLAIRTADLTVEGPVVANSVKTPFIISENAELLLYSQLATGSLRYMVAVGGGSGAGNIDGRFQVVTSSKYGDNNLSIVNINQSHAEADAINFQFNRSRGTASAPTAVNTGDDIIDLTFAGHDGGAYRVKATISATVDDAVSTNVVPTKLTFSTSRTTAGPITAVEIDSNQRTTFSGAIKLVIYADDTARDTAIPTPTAGMMVFNTTGTKFQGYTGSAWVDLN